MKKSGFTIMATLAAVTFVSHAPLIGGARAAQLTNNCDPSDHIDRSTIVTATKKFWAKGYSHLYDLTKGCDNYWHAHGMKHGNKVNIVLSPRGKIITEGD